MIALDEGGGTLLSSAPSSFNLPALLPSPVAISPRDGETIDAFMRSGFAFAWRPSAGATEYRLSLFRATAGAMIGLRDWHVSGNSVAVESMEFLAPDAYAWQLTAIKKGGPGEPEVSGRSATVTRYFRDNPVLARGPRRFDSRLDPGESADLPPDFRPGESSMSTKAGASERSGEARRTLLRLALATAFGATALSAAAQTLAARSADSGSALPALDAPAPVVFAWKSVPGAGAYLVDVKDEWEGACRAAGQGKRR